MIERLCSNFLYSYSILADNLMSVVTITQTVKNCKHFFTKHQNRFSCSYLYIFFHHSVQIQEKAISGGYVLERVIL